MSVQGSTGVQGSDILKLGLPLIKKWEGLRLKPYLCSANVATIGYGSTYYLDGRRVTLKDPAITKTVAEALLVNTVMKTYLPAVLENCSTLETAGQFAAVLSWTYNLGVGALRGSSMRKAILKKDWDKALAQLQKWNKAAGKVQPGLVNRRADEAQVFVFKEVLGVSPP